MIENNWQHATDEIRHKWRTTPDPVNCVWIKYIKYSDGSGNDGSECKHPEKSYSCYYVYMDEKIAMEHCPGFRLKKLLKEEDLKI